MPVGIKGFQKGNNFGTNKTSFKKGQKPWNFGKTTPVEVKKKQSLAKLGKTGEEANSWKGNDVGYIGIHIWLNKEFGKADCCENKECLKKSVVYDWALLKGKRCVRRRKHFIKLCRSCHIKYDIKRKVTNFKIKL